MADVVIRDLDERTIEKLKERAERNDRSLEVELQTILERAAMLDPVDGAVLAARIRQELAGREHSDSADLVADDRRR